MKKILMLLPIAIIVLSILIAKRNQARKILADYFSEIGHPINLAIFRIVIFITLLLSFDRQTVVWFSQFPRALIVPPTGLGVVLSHLPINETVASNTCTVFILVCVAGLLGFCSRTSALLAFVLGWYVIGIPQFYGKINHYHHLLWFLAILAASPCGDSLSIDGVIAAWKRADRGFIDPPGEARQYALPLRFVWMLMGVLYFFPGFWKAVNGGPAWILSNSLKYHMYAKWQELADWTPLFRIDRYPLLYRPSAAGTICFELSFIFLVLFPRIRPLAAVGGLLFHNLTYLFMGISFWFLQVIYVSFVNWVKVWNQIGIWLFPQRLAVLYDGNCQLCRRTIAILRTFDILNRIDYINALNTEAITRSGLPPMDQMLLLRDMHAVIGDRRWPGYEAYRAIVLRMPVFWLFVPLLCLWPVTMIGKWIYRRVADSRTCSISNHPQPVSIVSDPSLSTRLVMFVGAILVVGNVLMGFSRINSWPFSCYPTFESALWAPQVTALAMSVDLPSGRVVEVMPYKEQKKFKATSDRLFGLMGYILNVPDQNERIRGLQGLWLLWTKIDSSLKAAKGVRFYRDTLNTTPEELSLNPIGRELIYELHVDHVPSPPIPLTVPKEP